MARLPYLEADQVAPEYRDMLKRNTNLHKLLVNSPDMARAFNGVGNHIRFKSKLDPRLRELAILQVGYLTRSPYEYAHHIKIGRDFGVTDDDVRALVDETAGRTTALDPLTKAVLRAAREMTTDMTVSDDTFAALRQGLDNECLIDLVVTMAFYNGVVRLLATMQIDVEPDYLNYLDEFPLPKD